MAEITRRAASQLIAGSVALSCKTRNAWSADQRLSGPTLPDTRAINSLRRRLTGHLITPSMAEYESARLIFNRAFDRHPALIARCLSASDIARSLGFAQQHGLPVAVRVGGHNRAGLSSCDGGVVVDLSGLTQLRVDPAAQVAHAQGGTLTVHLDAATQQFGLATTLAGCPTVGIAGLTLGGGEGFLMSKHGAACDNLISARLITADGRHLATSQESNADLFWALRGGGGNFGVVTELQYRLHRLTDVLAGTMVYAAGHIPEMLQAFGQFLETVPDELNLVGQVVVSESGPRFQLVVCHSGELAQGAQLLQPFRALGPVEDNVRAQTYLQANATINPASPAAHFQTNVVVPALTEQVISVIAGACSGAPPFVRVFMVPIYGAIARVALGDTAFALRQNCCELDIMGRWVRDDQRLTAENWVKNLRDALAPYQAGTYVNQLGETSDELVRSAYGPHYARLQAIKRKYDPGNVFRLNQNIRPLASE